MSCLLALGLAACTTPGPDRPAPSAEPAPVLPGASQSPSKPDPGTGVSEAVTEATDDSKRVNPPPYAEPKAKPTPRPGPELPATAGPDRTPSIEPDMKPAEKAKPVVPAAEESATPDGSTTMEERQPVGGRTLSGLVALTADSRIEFAADEVAEAVAYFVPEGNYAAPTPKDDYIIQTRHKRFVPSVLPVEQGSTVAFPNADPILHNAFSVSPAGRFDVGLYGQGESKTVTFDQPGLIFVHCNVHHAMRAEILVMNTPWFTRVNDNGEFRLDGLPPQPGTLFVWHPRSKPESVPVAQGDENLMQTVEMRVSSPRVPKHTNKFGKPYRPTRPGE